MTLPGGERVAKLGQGTWEMGERRSVRDAEIAALRDGVELDIRLTDGERSMIDMRFKPPGSKRTLEML